MEINGRPAYKLPDKNVVCFYWEPRKNEVQSKRSGAPVYDKVLRAEIYSPGMSKQVHRPEIEVHLTHPIKDANGETSVIHRRSPYKDNGVEIPWRQYFRDALNMWERDQIAPDNGTPLEQWTKLDVAQVAALRDSKIFSVEMLADLPDNRLDAIGMGGRTLRDQAKAYLEETKGNSQTNALIAENNDLKERMARLETTLAEIKAAEPEKRGPGRPPKAA